MKKNRIMSKKNESGIRIRKMCASCHYKTVDNEGARSCLLTQLRVEQQHVCEKWLMSDGMRHAGYSGGKVKRREYLLFVFELRMQGCEDTLDTIRRRFEEETGLSPFILR